MKFFRLVFTLRNSAIALLSLALFATCSLHGQLANHAGTSVAQPQGVAFTYTQTKLVSLIGIDFAGVAVDTHGNVFVAEGSTNSVKEIVAINGKIPIHPTVRILSSSFLIPSSVAVDGEGNVFVADTQNNAVKEIEAVDGSIPDNPKIKTLSSAFSLPTGIALDKKENVYVADSEGIEEIVAVNGIIPDDPSIKVLGSGFSAPSGVTVDATGNVFVADTGNNAVKEIVAVEGSIPTTPVIISLDPPAYGFSDTPIAPYTVAVDVAGNVYFGDFYSLREIVAVDGKIPADSPTVVFLGANFNSPHGVAIDQKSNIFVTANNQQTYSGQGNSVLTELETGPLDFGPITFPGAKTIWLWITNVGNDILPLSPSINGPSYTFDPSDEPGSVRVGGTEILPVTFSPVQVGVHDDYVTLNNDGASTSTVGLLGRSPGISADSQNLKFSSTGLNLVFGTISATSSKSLPLTFINDGAPGGNVKLNFSVNGPSYTIPAATNGCRAGITSGQRCEVIVLYKPVGTGLHDDRLTITPTAGVPAFHLGLVGSAD